MPNRTLCSVLEELRKLNETRNYSSLLSYIEEIQGLANRMESALYDKNDLKRYSEKRHDLRLEVKNLTEQIENLKATLKVNGVEFKEEKSARYSWDD